MRQFVFRWIGATILGWAIGLLVCFGLISISTVGSMAGFSLFGGMIVLPGWTTIPIWIIALLGIGAILGMAQIRVALKDQLPIPGWIVASAVSIVTLMVGFEISTRLPLANLVTTEGGALSGMDAIHKPVSTWPITALTLATILGGTMALPTWLFLRRQVKRASLWLGANILGALSIFLSFMVMVYILANVALVDMLICCPVGPVVFTAITGIALFKLLLHPRNEAAQ